MKRGEPKLKRGIAYAVTVGDQMVLASNTLKNQKALKILSAFNPTFSFIKIEWKEIRKTNKQRSKTQILKHKQKRN